MILILVFLFSHGKNISVVVYEKDCSIYMVRFKDSGTAAILDNEKQTPKVKLFGRDFSSLSPPSQVGLANVMHSSYLPKLVAFSRQYKEMAFLEQCCYIKFCQWLGKTQVETLEILRTVQ